jgi:hypothetical protein
VDFVDDDGPVREAKEVAGTHKADPKLACARS